MSRTDINPWEWSKAFGFSQAVDVRGTGQLLVCSGQTAIADDGSPPTTADMGEQVKKAFDNLGDQYGLMWRGHWAAPRRENFSLPSVSLASGLSMVCAS